MEAKYCIILLLWLTAFRRADCFVLSDVPVFKTTNAEKPAEGETKDTFTPIEAFPISSNWDGLRDQSGKCVVANELRPPKLEGDTDNTISTIQGTNETGDNGPTILALVDQTFGQLFALTCLCCAVAVLFLELMYRLTKFVKRIIRHRIYHLP